MLTRSSIAVYILIVQITLTISRLPIQLSVKKIFGFNKMMQELPAARDQLCVPGITQPCTTIKTPVDGMVLPPYLTSMVSLKPQIKEGESLIPQQDCRIQGIV